MRSCFRLRFFASLTTGLVLALHCGCSLWPGKVQPPASIAETDQTLSAPMRPPSEQKYQWWEFQSLLDPRSRDIEKHLGY